MAPRQNGPGPVKPDWKESRTDAFYERLSVRAATIDELLSDDFEPLPGQKEDADLAARRLAAWCRSCASGDWSLFGRRLERDGLTLAQVLTRFATVRRKASASAPAWVDDAIWIEAALQSPAQTAKPLTALVPAEPCAFEHLFTPVVEQAESCCGPASTRGRSTISTKPRATASAIRCSRSCPTCAPRRSTSASTRRGRPMLPRPMRPSRGRAPALALRPVCRRNESRRFPPSVRRQAGAVAADCCVTRQWIDTSREFVLRLDADLAAIRRDLLRPAPTAELPGSKAISPTRIMAAIRSRSSASRTASRVVYKPKDLRVDVAWHALIERLNRADPPVELKAVRAIARDGYGWTEFIDHTGCTDREGCKPVFPARRRLAGAVPLLCGDRHASGEHDRGRRSSGADRPGNDPSGHRRRAQGARPRGPGLRRRDGNHRQFGA